VEEERRYGIKNLYTVSSLGLRNKKETWAREEARVKGDEGKQ
jgi:hypothetical protein